LALISAADLILSRINGFANAPSVVFPLQNIFPSASRVITRIGEKDLRPSLAFARAPNVSRPRTLTAETSAPDTTY
jgi:hypothetical protein